MKRLIVSRHPAAIEFIREQLSEFADAPVLATATEDDVREAVVAGNLPLPRGAEYSLEEMKAAGAVLRRYLVSRLCRKLTPII